MNTDEPQKMDAQPHPPTEADRLEACSREIAAALRRHGCRLAAAMLPAESVGDGSRLLLSAECRVILSK